jgi:hypothetical protein
MVFGIVRKASLPPSQVVVLALFRSASNRSTQSSAPFISRRPHFAPAGLSCAFLCDRRRIVVGSKGETLSHIWSLPFASRLAALLKLHARYSAENTNLTPEGEPVVACRPIKIHRCPLTLALP